MIARARAAGLTTIVANGLNPRDNDAVLALAAREPIVRPALGFYPVDTVLLPMRAAGVEYPREGDECSADEGIAYLRAHVEQAFAVGEIGLDGYWVPEPFWAEQERVFRALVRARARGGQADHHPHAQARGAHARAAATSSARRA